MIQPRVRYVPEGVQNGRSKASRGVFSVRMVLGVASPLKARHRAIVGLLLVAPDGAAAVRKR